MTTLHEIFAKKRARNKTSVVDTRPREYCGVYERASTDMAAETAKSCGREGIVGACLTVARPMSCRRLIVTKI